MLHTKCGGIRNRAPPEFLLVHDSLWSTSRTCTSWGCIWNGSIGRLHSVIQCIRTNVIEDFHFRHSHDIGGEEKQREKEAMCCVTSELKLRPCSYANRYYVVSDWFQVWEFQITRTWKYGIMHRTLRSLGNYFLPRPAVAQLYMHPSWLQYLPPEMWEH